MFTSGGRATIPFRRGSRGGWWCVGVPKGGGSTQHCVIRKRIYSGRSEAWYFTANCLDLYFGPLLFSLFSKFLVRFCNSGFHSNTGWLYVLLRWFNGMRTAIGHHFVLKIIIISKYTIIDKWIFLCFWLKKYPNINSNRISHWTCPFSSLNIV